MNCVLCIRLNYISILIGRGEAFCWGIYVAVPNSSYGIAVGLDSAVAPLQVDVVEDDVSARDCVTASKLHGLLASWCPGYVSIHYLGYVDCWRLMTQETRLLGRIVCVRVLVRGIKKSGHHIVTLKGPMDWQSSGESVPGFGNSLASHSRIGLWWSGW